MILTDLWLHNWQLFAGDHHVSFEGKVAPYFIRGTYLDSPPESNGAGKSALIEVLPYVNFGHHRFSVAASLVFNEADEMWVQARYILDNGSELIVKRGATKSGTSTFEVSGCTQEDRQSYLEKILGTSLKDFLLTRFVMQDDLHAFVKMKPAEKKTRFREWLDITHWEKAENVAKADLKATEEKLIALDAELNVHRTDVSKLDTLPTDGDIRAGLNLTDFATTENKAKWEAIQKKRAEQTAQAEAARKATVQRLNLADQIFRDEKSLPGAKEHDSKRTHLGVEITHLTAEKVKIEKAVTWIEDKRERETRVEREKSAVTAAEKTASIRVELQTRIANLQGLREDMRKVGDSISEGRRIQARDGAVRTTRSQTRDSLHNFKGTCPIDSGKCPRDMADAAAALDKEIEARDAHLKQIADAIVPFVEKEKALEVEVNKLQEDQRYLQAVVGETVEAATSRLKAAETHLQAMPPYPADVPEHGVLAHEETVNKTLAEAQSDLRGLGAQGETSEAIAARLEANRRALAALPDVQTVPFDIGAYTREEDALRAAQEKVTADRDNYLALLAERKRLSSIQDKVKAEETRRAILVADQTRMRYVAYMFGPNGIPSYQTENAFVEIENAANAVLAGIGKTFRIELKAWKELSELDPNCPICGAKYLPRAKSCPCGGERRRKRRDEILLMMKEGTREAEIDADSGGRRTLMAFALRLGLSRFLLRRRGGEGGPLCLDEIFGALDKVNSRGLLAVIAEEGKMFPQIFVISHTDLVDSPPGSVLTVTRAGDRSTVEWET